MFHETVITRRAFTTENRRRALTALARANAATHGYRGRITYRHRPTPGHDNLIAIRIHPLHTTQEPTP